MGYKKEFLEKIIEINGLLSQEGEIKMDTIKKIVDYFDVIKSLGTFSLNEWKIEWRKEVYKFGEFFKDKNPSEIFKNLDIAISKANDSSESEVLEYIKSEIFMNFFPPQESIDYLKELSKKYELNPEFKNTLGVSYFQIGKHKKASEFIKQAIKLDSRNEDWLRTIYKIEYGIAENLIRNKKHDKADEYLKNIITSGFYKKNISDEFQNFFIFLNQRNKDQLLIENKLKSINEKSKNLIETLFENSKIKLIEILGFFTAIIAFIFGTITISVKTELPSALILITSFGLVMLIFSLALSILFVKSEEALLKDKRLWALIIILLLNISMIFVCKPLLSIITSLCK